MTTSTSDKDIVVFSTNPFSVVYVERVRFLPFLHPLSFITILALACAFALAAVDANHAHKRWKNLQRASRPHHGLCFSAEPHTACITVDERLMIYPTTRE